MLTTYTCTLKKTVATVLADLSVVGTASNYAFHEIVTGSEDVTALAHHQILETETQQSWSLFDVMKLSQEWGATRVSQLSPCDSCAGRDLQREKEYYYTIHMVSENQ